MAGIEDYEYPIQKVTIAGDEAQAEILTTDVIQRENKIWDAVLIANNYEGEVYLNKANLGDEVCIYYKFEDKEDDDWTLVFSGWVEELNPKLDMMGKVCGIKAFGKGIALKKMRVVDSYGEGSRNSYAFDRNFPVDAFVNVNHDFSTVGANPWLNNDNGDTSYIYMGSQVGNLNKYDEYYTFESLDTVNPCIEKLDIDTIHARLKARLFDAGSGVPTNVNVEVLFWNCETEAYVSAGIISISTTGYVLYSLDISGIMDWDYEKVENTRMKLVFNSCTGCGADKGEFRITWAYLDIEGVGYCYTTFCSIMRDRIIPDFVEEVLDRGIDSSYRINDDYIVEPNLVLSNCDIGSEGCGEESPFRFKYLYFPFEPVISCMRDMLNLVDAGRLIDGCDQRAGYHWIVKPKCGEESLLMVAPIGNHNVQSCADNLIEDEWATLAFEGKSIDAGRDQIISRFSTKQPRANYIVNFGKYEWGVKDYATEGHADEWDIEANLTSVTNEGNIVKVGNLSILGYIDTAPKTGGFFYPKTFDLNIDLSKIGTSRTIPTISFYIRRNEHVKTDGGVEPFIEIGTGDPANNDYYWTDLMTLMPTADEWYFVTLPIGYYSNKERQIWTAVGTPDWNQVDYIQFWFTAGGNDARLYIDDLRIEGILTRGAYSSSSISTHKARIDLITDSLAKSCILDEDDDSGLIAQFAKGELMTAMTTPTTGKVKIALHPEVLPGQIAHIRACEDDEEIFVIDMQMRILEVQHHFSVREASTILTLTDDVLNSYVREHTDAFNALMRATNLDFQDRNRGDLKGRDIDIEQTILDKDYG